MRRMWKVVERPQADSARDIMLSLPECALDILKHLAINKRMNANRLSSELDYKQPWTHTCCKKLLDLELIKPVPSLTLRRKERPFTLTPDGLVVSLASLFLNLKPTYRLVLYPDKEIEDILNVTCYEIQGTRKKLANFVDTVVSEHRDLLPSIFERWNLFRITNTEGIAKVNLLVSALSQKHMAVCRLVREIAIEQKWEPHKIAFLRNILEYSLLRDFLTLRMDKYDKYDTSAGEVQWSRRFGSSSRLADDALHNPDIERRWFIAVSKDPFFRDHLMRALHEHARHTQEITGWIEKSG